MPSVTQIDMVLGAFDAVVTVEGDDDKSIEAAVAGISKTRGVKEAKPLVEVKVSSYGDFKQVVGAAPSTPRRGRPSPAS